MPLLNAAACVQMIEAIRACDTKKAIKLIRHYIANVESIRADQRTSAK